MNLAIGQGLGNKIKYKRYTNTVYMFLLYNLLCCVKAQKCVVALCSFKNKMPNDLIICLPEKAYEIKMKILLVDKNGRKNLANV